jgi:hypothetical protein
MYRPQSGLGIPLGWQLNMWQWICRLAAARLAWGWESLGSMLLCVYRQCRDQQLGLTCWHVCQAGTVQHDVLGRVPAASCDAAIPARTALPGRGPCRTCLQVE